LQTGFPCGAADSIPWHGAKQVDRYDGAPRSAEVHCEVDSMTVRDPARRCVARAALGACASLLLLACHGYYPSWHYAPNEEIHALHLGSDRDPEPTARVSARIAGILRPENGSPRRMHARFAIDSTGKQDVVFKVAQTTVTPSGASPIPPSPAAGDVGVPPGAHRDLELYFDLPDPAVVPNSALETIELAWTLEIDGAPHTSRATFRRAQYADPGPGYWYGDPYWYGPPYWDDPWYWHHGYWGHGGFVIVDHR
jgi:hypothetical protein